MYQIDLLVKEHENIIAFTEYLRKLCCLVIDGADIDIKEFHECIDFARTYADAYHHGKEEQILFPAMLEKLGSVAEKMVRNGMLVEHDLGRYHIKGLETALAQYAEEPSTKGKLNIIAHTAGYADLLGRHIEKENAVCFNYALRELPEDCKVLLDEQTKVFEENAEKDGVREKYLSWLEKRR